MLFVLLLATAGIIALWVHADRRELRFGAPTLRRRDQWRHHPWLTVTSVAVLGLWLWAL